MFHKSLQQTFCETLARHKQQMLNVVIQQKAEFEKLKNRTGSDVLGLYSVSMVYQMHIDDPFGENINNSTAS